jgi:hypothetical protein
MSLISKISAFARSPQGKQLMSQAQRVARDPKTRAQIVNLRTKIARRGAR